MVVQRMSGKKYNPSSGRPKGMSSGPELSGSQRSSGRPKKKKSSSRRESGSIRRRDNRNGNRSRRGRRSGRAIRRRSGPDGRAFDDDAAAERWSASKIQRIFFAVIALIIATVGIALIVIGVREENAYTNANSDEDDDYFYNDDQQFPEEDPIYAPETPPSFEEGLDSRPGPAGLPQPPPVQFTTPAPTVPPVPNVETMSPTSKPTANPTLQPTTAAPTPPTYIEDALHKFIMQSYESVGYPSDGLRNNLDPSVQSVKPRTEQSPQWRAYQKMAERDDILDQSEGSMKDALLMDEGRVIQIYALMVFYKSLGWGHISGKEECQYPGVACRGGLGPDAEEDLRVVSLEVRGTTDPPREDGTLDHRLKGDLPIELMFLEDLKTLDLSHNRITGRLDGIMFRWKHMKQLELNDNLIEGDIPSELGGLPVLQKLTLHHNEFLGSVPEELCTLRDTTLHFLWVDCSPVGPANTPKVECPIENCCSICFEGYDDDGGPLTGGENPTEEEMNPPQGGADEDGPKPDVTNDDENVLKLKIVDESSDGGTALEDTASPQFRAYAWLVEEFSDEYTDERLFQRYALATLYFATDGANWKISDNWVSNKHECEWHGVSGCTGSYGDRGFNSVMSIELKDNQLKGSIPPEIFEFSPNLGNLNLAINDLSGPLPNEISSLQNLEILELAENHLTSIPTELGDIPSISHVFLQLNDFGGQEMPSEVCDLRAEKLTLLWADCRGDSATVQCDDTCCSACFEPAPEELNKTGDSGDGSNVVNGVDMANPPGGVTASKTDDVVTHSDREGHVLKMLKKIAPDGGASLNDLLSAQFKAYSWLVGSEESIDVHVPDILVLQRYAMATLYYSLAGHGWVDKDKWLTDADVCEWDTVEYCAGNMVTELGMYSNNLVGQIPVEITHIRMLELLDLTDNELYGTIPTEFGYFADLEILRLGGNLLTGTIPFQLGQLAGLQELYLHDNEFLGTSMPDEICGMRNEENNGLTTLWADCEVDDNGESHVWCEDSCCDECFGDNSEFIFYLGYDTYPPTTIAPTSPPIPGRPSPPTASPVTTSAPVEAENPDLKEHLKGYMHQSPTLEARLSDESSHAYEAFLWLGSSKNLSEMSEFQKLQRYGLVTFYLSTIQDHDWKVPKGWKSDDHECSWFGIVCEDSNTTLTEINLPSNRMSGTIPPEIALAGVGNKINRIDISGNNIRGNIPKEIKNLNHLQTLDLRANDFTGEIPSEIGQLTTLKSLQLEANELEGVMPEEICLLKESNLSVLIADCDSELPFSKVTCEVNTCCTECY